MLIQIAFFIFMLLGVTALFVDMGIVELTQLQMQNAAETAALEGLRQRDAQSDEARREAVSTYFQDANNGAGINAGPQAIFDGPGLPNGDLNASQEIDVQNSGYYSPTLQPNTGNDATGDMVSGTYTPQSLPMEMSDYERNDFPSVPVTNPAAVSTDPSFLVRLRRTDHRNDAVDRNPPVSSSGESIPLLFGRGTVIEPHNGVNDYNPRVDGITVRATAIADARLALRVGPPAAAVPGAAPFYLDQASWIALTSADSLGCFQVDSADASHLLGMTTSASASPSFIPKPINGYFYGYRIISYPISPGAPIRPLAPATPTLFASGVAYAPLYDGVSAISSFGYLTLTSSSDAMGNPTYMCDPIYLFQVQATVSGIAPKNASATPFSTGPLPTPLPGALLAPVLVR